MRKPHKESLLFSALLILIVRVVTGCNFSKPQDNQQENTETAQNQRVVRNRQPTPNFSIADNQRSDDYTYFMAIGDQGTGGDGQRRVAFLMNEKAGRDSLHFVITLGDNFYPRGVPSTHDIQWSTKFEAMYDLPNLSVPFYPSLGNHDHRDGNARHQVEYSKKSDKWRMPDYCYTFSKSIDEHSSVQFFALNTHVIVTKEYGGYDLQQMEWLAAELRASTATWKIVYGHHPVFSYGKHGDQKQMIKLVKPLLEKYEVDVFIAGHDHDRQFLGPVSGVAHIVCGTGAKSRDTRYGKKTVFAETNLGFTWFRVSATELHLQFINGDGEIEYAHTLSKPPPKRGPQKLSSRTFP
jgi:hypothetical protein